MKWRSTFYPFLSLICLLLLMSCVFLSTSSAQEKLVVAGTGDSQALLKVLAEEFTRLNPDLPVAVPYSIGSSGGIRGLLQNSFDLARTARPVKPEEQDGTLIEYPFAVSPVVFATHPSFSGIEELSDSDVVDIYQQKIINWKELGGPDAPIYALGRETGDSSRSVIERHIERFRTISPEIKIFYTTPETVEAVSHHPYTIAYMPKDMALAGHLNILALNGIPASSDNVRSGRYVYILTFFIVAREPVSASAKRFIDFLYSEEATGIIEDRGLVPLEKR